MPLLHGRDSAFFGSTYERQQLLQPLATRVAFGASSYGGIPEGITSGTVGEFDYSDYREATDLADYRPLTTSEAVIVMKLPAGTYTPALSSQAGDVGVGLIGTFQLSDKSVSAAALQPLIPSAP